MARAQEPAEERRRDSLEVKKGQIDWLARAELHADNEDNMQEYRVVLPPGTTPGSQIRMAIASSEFPGRKAQATIAVPPDAVPGSIISFCLPGTWADTRLRMNAVMKMQALARGARARVAARQGATPTAMTRLTPTTSPAANPNNGIVVVSATPTSAQVLTSRWAQPVDVEAAQQDGCDDLFPYAVLGVSRGASADDIKDAYRGQARRWHPDRHRQSGEDDIAEAERMTKRLNLAYVVLSDPYKRLLYDSGRPLQEVLTLSETGPARRDAATRDRWAQRQASFRKAMSEASIPEGSPPPEPPLRRSREGSPVPSRLRSRDGHERSQPGQQSAEAASSRPHVVTTQRLVVGVALLLLGGMSLGAALTHGVTTSGSAVRSMETTLFVGDAAGPASPHQSKIALATEAGVALLLPTAATVVVQQVHKAMGPAMKAAVAPALAPFARGAGKGLSKGLGSLTAKQGVGSALTKRACRTAVGVPVVRYAVRTGQEAHAARVAHTAAKARSLTVYAPELIVAYSLKTGERNSLTLAPFTPFMDWLSSLMV